MGTKWGFWLSLLNLSLFAAIAMANPFQKIQGDEPVCFSKSYDRSHMNARPNQTVQALDLKFKADTRNAGMLTLDIIGTVRGPKGGFKVYKTSMMCNQNSTSLHCFIECDGGSADISWENAFTENGITFKNNGFVMYGGCGEDVNEEDILWIDPKAQGDDVFILEPTKFCLDQGPPTG